MLVGMVPLPVLPARAPSPNLFPSSSKPFVCHTSKEPLKFSKLSNANTPATPFDSIIGYANSFGIHTSTHAPKFSTVNPFESASLSPKFFPCHRSAKCVPNSFTCHTSKITLPQVLYLPHIRDSRGGDGFVVNGSPRTDFRPVRPRGLERSRPVQSPVTNYQSPRTLDFELSTVNFSPGAIAGPRRLGAIRRIDANVLCSEVAGPVAGTGLACVQVHNQRNVFGKKFVAGGALVEIERLAAPQDGDARHLDIHARRVEENAGAPGGGEDAAPVGVAAGEGGFHQRRSRNGFRDAACVGFVLRV